MLTINRMKFRLDNLAEDKLFRRCNSELAVFLEEEYEKKEDNKLVLSNFYAPKIKRLSLMIEFYSL